MRQLFASLTNVLVENMVFYYAVARGRKPGIYNRWEDCKAQVDQFAGPIFKKFPSKAEAEHFIQTQGGPSSEPDTTRGVFAAATSSLRSALPSPSKTVVDLPYKVLEERLLEWAEAAPKISQFSVTVEAAKIANSLGIENFNENGGWLRYHIESNLHVYKGLRTNHPTGIATAREADEARKRQHDAQKLSALESRIVGLPKSDGSFGNRIDILKKTLDGMNKEFLVVSRAFSTKVETSGPSNPKRQRIEDETAEVEDIINRKNHANIWANFNIDGEGYVNVFTDGACSSNGRSEAAAGIGVWFGDNHPLNVSQPVIGRSTNNMAEIQAVTVAAKQAHKVGVKRLKVNTDSQFLINCITIWMPKWKRNGWKKPNGETPINKRELIELETALKPLDVTWNHVRGHIGIYGNEMADKLARDGAVQNSG